MDSPTYTADAVLAELARKRRTRADLAEVLEMTPTTLRTRLDGKTPFTIPEIAAISTFLGVPMTTFLPPVDTAVSA